MNNSNKYNSKMMWWIIIGLFLVFLGFIAASLRTTNFSNTSSRSDTETLLPKSATESTLAINSFLVNNETKINFIKGSPRLFLGTDNLPSMLKADVGTLNLANNEIVIGYNEAIALKASGLIMGVGDSMSDFFGLSKVRVAGILKPTGTLIDNYYFMNNLTLANLTSSAKIKIVAANELLKIYYYINYDNIPEKIKSEIGNLGTVELDGDTYIPAYIGAYEAGVMDMNGHIYNVGDIARNLFGNRVIVAGILSKTNTVLDMMHFVGPGFYIKD